MTWKQFFYFSFPSSSYLSFQWLLSNTVNRDRENEVVFLEYICQGSKPCKNVVPGVHIDERTNAKMSNINKLGEYRSCTKRSIVVIVEREEVRNVAKND